MINFLHFRHSHSAFFVFLIGLSLLIFPVPENVLAAESKKNPQEKALKENGTGNETSKQTAQPAIERNTMSVTSRQVIENHLQAIRQRDPHLLWQYVSQSYREDFRSPDELMQYMKRQRQGLYEHLSYNYLETAPQGEKIVEKVELTTRSGGKVLAFFKLVRGEQGEWKIDHITLLESDSQAI